MDKYTIEIGNIYNIFTSFVDGKPSSLTFEVALPQYEDITVVNTMRFNADSCDTIANLLLFFGTEGVSGEYFLNNKQKVLCLMSGSQLVAIAPADDIYCFEGDICLAWNFFNGGGMNYD